jgi:RNA polymerase-binding transcription factor DksA
VEAEGLAGAAGGGGGGARLLLSLERERTLAQIKALASDFESIVASCESDAYDDEHDPEGHTIAYERQQVAALLREARSHLDELDRAVDRLGAGTYGRCEVCGADISEVRLASRPAASTCVTCATRVGPVLRPG